MQTSIIKVALVLVCLHSIYLHISFTESNDDSQSTTADKPVSIGAFLPIQEPPPENALSEASASELGSTINAISLKSDSRTLEAPQQAVNIGKFMPIEDRMTSGVTFDSGKLGQKPINLGEFIPIEQRVNSEPSFDSSESKSLGDFIEIDFPQ